MITIKIIIMCVNLKHPPPLSLNRITRFQTGTDAEWQEEKHTAIIALTQLHSTDITLKHNPQYKIVKLGLQHYDITYKHQ